jgi:hypothetical protein
MAANKQKPLHFLFVQGKHVQACHFCTATPCQKPSQ